MKGNSRLKQVTYPGCSATATTSGFSIAIYSLSCNKTNLLSPYADMPVNGLMAATDVDDCRRRRSVAGHRPRRPKKPQEVPAYKHRAFGVDLLCPAYRHLISYQLSKEYHKSAIPKKSFS